jgi:aminopeptidase N
MENFGCVTLSEDLFLFRGPVSDFEYEKRANHILHELAHMWFGNLVTMRWWDDIWLKEAFAEWASHWCAGAWTTFLAVRKNWAYRADQLSSTHPVSTAMPDVEAVEANFDGITYAKGASVIKQLVAYVGEDAFLTGLRTYLMRHAYGNATFEDLLTCLEEASAQSLRDYASQWLQTSSVNTLRPVLTVDGGRYTNVVVEQTAPADHPTLRTHRIAIGVYDSSRRRSLIPLTVQGPSTPVPSLTGQPVADVVLVNDDDLTYAKVRFDPRSLATVLAGLPEFESSLVRGLCWAAAWDMTRDAELAARDYVRLVCDALPLESDINLVTAPLGTSEPASAKVGQVRVMLDQYADPSWAPVGRQMLADAARPLSGAWAHAYLTAARSPADLADLRGWLADPIDPELRWNVLSALIALGAADPAEIDEELAGDRTAAGERAAATARALIPTAAAKAAAWRRLTTGRLPNWEQRALLFGFYHPSQLELTQPYAQAYFDVLREFWAHHDNQNAQQFAVYGYPALHVDQSTVDSSDAFLRAPGPGPLRRFVEDGRDGVLRALAARAMDA